MLLETSRKRYIKLHPEYESKLKALEKPVEEKKVSGASSQEKPHMQ